MYLTTRPNIMYVVSLISRFMKSPRNSHWQVGKRNLRYIAETKGFRILYSNTGDDFLIGYIDNDFVGSMDDMKSVFDYVLYIYFCSGVISWASKKQPIVRISSKQCYIYIHHMK